VARAAIKTREGRPHRHRATHRPSVPGTGLGLAIPGERRQDTGDKPGRTSDKAGLKPGDVIVTVDGKPIAGANDPIVAIRGEVARATPVQVDYKREERPDRRFN